MSQLTLFAPAPKPAYEDYMPPGVRRMWVRARSPEVQEDILAVFHSRPADWIKLRDFSTIMIKHDIGALIGHILTGMTGRGLIEEKSIPLGQGIGAEHPGSPNFRGTYSVYQLTSAPGEQPS